MYDFKANLSLSSYMKLYVISFDFPYDLSIPISVFNLKIYALIIFSIF